MWASGLGDGGTHVRKGGDEWKESKNLGSLEQKRL